MGRVSYPSSLNCRTLCEFSRELSEIPVSGKLQIDTGPRRSFSPTALIMLAKAGNRRNAAHKSEKITYTGLDNHVYPNNLGFSETLRITNRPFPQKAFGGQSYIPITRMFRSELEEKAAVAAIHLGDQIQAECAPIAQTVSQNISPQLTVTLAEMFREIFRNIFEHSGADVAGYCAQYWKTSGKVEMCIADKGMGIRESLLENKYLQKDIADLEALKLAVLPGVSSKAWRHKKKKAAHKSDWDNAGYGLFLTHKLFGRLGHFMVASGKSAIYFQDSNRPQTFDCEIEGTVVSMSLNLTDEELIDEVLRGIRNEAADVKAKIGTKSVDMTEVDKYFGF